MQNRSGWVCLHRSLLQWEWWDEPNTTRLFIYCLLKANHSQQKWRGITVEAGQFIFGIQQCKNESSMSTQSIRTSMNRLISTGSLTRQVTSRHSLITVVNWAKFQSANSLANSLANTLLTGNQQAPNRLLTGNQPQTTMITMSNNVKNETPTTTAREPEKLEPWLEASNLIGLSKDLHHEMKAMCSRRPNIDPCLVAHKVQGKYRNLPYGDKYVMFQKWFISEFEPKPVDENKRKEEEKGPYWALFEEEEKREKEAFEEAQRLKNNQSPNE